ncbi:MAG: hypothetical protein FWD11_04790, partial [Micrococcales bacterium]|nr:hypothetical protein [Micrococcales bacterium]
WDVWERWTDSKNPDRSHGEQKQSDPMPCTYTMVGANMELSCPYATADGGVDQSVNTYERSYDETNFDGLRQ